MIARSKLKKRFLSDSYSVQLGNIATNLARIATYSADDHHEEIVEQLLDESKFLIEWAAPNAIVEDQFELIELQRSLVHWQFTLPDIWLDSEQRRVIEKKARAWSERIVQMSGLLDEAVTVRTKTPA